MTDYDDAMTRARGRAAALDDAADDLARIRCHARSADGEVSAVVDGTGTLVELRLGRDTRLAMLIVDTVRAAAHEAARRRRAVLADLLTDIAL